jgi:hypothetical protein
MGEIAMLLMPPPPLLPLLLLPFFLYLLGTPAPKHEFVSLAINMRDNDESAVST